MARDPADILMKSWFEKSCTYVHSKSCHLHPFEQNSINLIMSIDLNLNIKQRNCTVKVWWYEFALAYWIYLTASFFKEYNNSESK